MRFFAIITLLLCRFYSVIIYAQSDTDAIVIGSGTESYIYNISEKRCFIDKKSTINYECIQNPKSITVPEFYDDNTEIKRVSVKASKKVTPIYEMYQDATIFYNDSRVCYFDLPFTKPGESITVDIEKRYNEIETFNTIPLFDLSYIKNKTVQVIVPNEMSIDIVEKNLDHNIEKNIITNPKKQTTTYSYSIKDQAGYPNEPNMPAYIRTQPYLLIIPRKAELKKKTFIFFESFDDVYYWYKEKTDMVQNNESIISEFAKKITSHCKTEEEKIAEIFSWVQNNIRYVAIVDGLAGYVPDDAQEVLRKKYGDCKGMSNLLKSLLCAEGFDARLTWVGVDNTELLREIPLPRADHMICTLFYRGEKIFLDATVQYMIPGEYPHTIEGKTVLIENGDHYILDDVRKIDPAQNSCHSSYIYQIEGNLLKGKVHEEFTGEWKNGLLSHLFTIESSKRMGSLKQSLEKEGRKISNIKTVRDDSKTKTFEITYDEELAGEVNILNEEIYINLENQQKYLYNTIDTTKRKSDFTLFYKRQTVCKKRLMVPSGYAVSSLPPELTIERANYFINIQYTEEDGCIKYRKEIILKDPWLRKKDFAVWNADLALLKKKISEQIVLKKTSKTL
ncbi:MAG: transglutaminase-like domain-containing protein [Bacteroidales bacterium]|nr:transglutaminase-like domain-containing protein [Bacteroidales bacterium]